METPSYLESTNSLTTPQKNTESFSVTSQSQDQSLLKPLFSKKTMPHHQLIGEKKESSLQLRIKVNAVHAGLSHQLVPLKDITPFQMASSFHSLSNNSLIATEVMETLVAMVEKCTLLSNMLSRTHSNLSPSTHTKHMINHAHTTNQRATLNQLASKEFPRTHLLNSRLLLPKVQSPLPSKLTMKSSKLTKEVSLIQEIVEPTLITVSSLLVMVTILLQSKTTTSLRTHGVQAGVTMVTSKSLPSMVRVSAVSKWTLSTHLLTSNEHSQWKVIIDIISIQCLINTYNSSHYLYREVNK